MVLAICFGGLALCLAVELALYGREVRRMAAWLRGRDRRSNARMTVEVPGLGLTALARAVNESLDATDGERCARERAQGQFQRDLASLSHDIRTPLTGAKGYVALAVDEPDPSRRAHYLEAADARLSDMEGLLNSLFSYTKAMDGGAANAACPRLVAVLPVVAEVLLGQFPAFEERGWEPRVDFADEGFTVEADPEALSRICENLVSNVLRYGATAPVVTQRGRTLAFSNEVEAPETLDVARLFEPFYRADVSRARGGAGLGLAVVKNLAEAMGAQVSAALEDRALTVALTFPELL